MQDVIDALTLEHISEVKVILTSAAAAIVRVALISAAYGRLRLKVLAPSPARRAHRAIGDAVVAVTVIVSLFCIGYFGLEAKARAPIALLLTVLSLKIAAVRAAAQYAI